MTLDTQIITAKASASAAPKADRQAASKPEQARSEPEFASLLDNPKDSVSLPEIGFGAPQTPVALPERQIVGALVVGQPTKPSALPAADGAIPILGKPDPDADNAPQVSLTKVSAEIQTDDRVANSAVPKAQELSAEGPVRARITPETVAQTADVTTSSNPYAAKFSVPLGFETGSVKVGAQVIANEAVPQSAKSETPHPTTIKTPTGTSLNSLLAQQAVSATAPSPGVKSPTAAMDATIVETADDGSAPLEFELRQTEPGRSESIRSETMKPEPGRSETVRTISGQLIEVIKQGRDGRVDVSLNPEELGRVRLTLSGSDAILHVTIQSERPETGDLLRRHIAQLQQDFQDLGYVNVSIDFGQSTGQSPHRNEDQTAGHDFPHEAAAELDAKSAAQPQTRNAAMNSSMDIRL